MYKRQILENLYAAVNEGADLVVSISFSTVDGVLEVAPTAPDVDFLLVDACPFGHGLANVHCAVFREHEASFLMGATAALVTQSDTIGTVGPIDIPFMHRFTGGFAEGAHFVNPDLNVETRWVGGQNPFSDPVRAKEQARALNAIGADVIYAAAAGGSFGIFEAAAEDGFKVFGVDSNLCGIAAGAMYDVALKHVDQAILQSVEAIVGGADSYFASYGLAEGGMGALSLLEGDALANSGCLVADEADVVAKIRDISAQIIAGDIKITDPLAQ